MHKRNNFIKFRLKDCIGERIIQLKKYYSYVDCYSHARYLEVYNLINSIYYVLIRMRTL